jgi:hypothetical protein
MIRTAVRSILGATALALCGLVLAGGGLAGSVPLTKPTEVVVVKPFGPLGLLHAYRVTANVRGTCLGGSLADQRRRDAWRCIAGNEILDPCFKSPSITHGFLACFEAPWSKRVVGLHLTKPLPAHGPTRGGFPWGIQLASGKRCTFETGASGVVDGKRINYGCIGGGVLVGTVHRSSPAWTVFYQAGNTGTGPLVREPIAVVWY